MGGQPFTASNVQLQGTLRSPVVHRVEGEFANRFRVGESVLTHYNPVNPEEAVLQPGISGGFLPLAVYSVLFIGVVLGIILSVLNV